MAKIKIHELAKELEVSSKEVITFLNDKGMEVKSHMSSIEDEAIDLVKGRFGKKAEAPKAEAPKAEAPKPEAKAEPAKAESAKADAQKPAEAPKKKKNIILSIMVLIQKDLTSIQEKNLKVMVNIFLVTQGVLRRTRE